MVCFESVQHPGQHLGILADGSLKAPTATGKGDHGRFHIIADKLVRTKIESDDTCIHANKHL